jgi:predicted aconitase with swiveling domain
MAEISIKCRKIFGGSVYGEAIVSSVPLSLVSEIDEIDGTIRAKGHALEGKSVAQKILIYPESKGSTFAGVVLKNLVHNKCQPKAIVTIKQPDHSTIQGVIMAEIPAVCLPETDPLSFIKTGDMVEVNATEGILRFSKQEP